LIEFLNDFTISYLYILLGVRIINFSPKKGFKFYNYEVSKILVHNDSYRFC